MDASDAIFALPHYLARALLPASYVIIVRGETASAAGSTFGEVPRDSAYEPRIKENSTPFAEARPIDCQAA